MVRVVFVERLRFFGFIGNWENFNKIKGGNNIEWVGLGIGGRVEFWMCYIECIEKVLLEFRLWKWEWNEREEVEKFEELLRRESIDEKIVASVCVCGWVER